METTVERHIVSNRIQTPDGTILISKHRHDFNIHDDENGARYGVDGGLSYLKRMGPHNYKEMSVYSDDPFEKVRECLYRGTRGKDGQQPFKYVLLKDMEEDHINATITHIHEQDQAKQLDWYLTLLRTELWYRQPRYDDKGPRESDNNNDGTNGDKISANVPNSTIPRV